MQNSWIQAVARRWRMRGLREPYRSLLDQDDGLLVSIDCETTSLNVKEAELLSIAAVCIDGRRLCTRDAFYALITPQHAPDGQNVACTGCARVISARVCRFRMCCRLFFSLSEAEHWWVIICNTTLQC